MTDPEGDVWTHTPDEAPMADEPGIADDLGPDGGATPTDIAPADGMGEADDLAPVDPGIETPEADPRSGADDRIGLAGDDEILA